MSGQWGDRPLGRGDGGYSNPKSVWFFWPFCCAREQQDDTQEQTGHNRGVTPENPKQLPITWVVCSLPNSPSIARPVHSFQYSRSHHASLFLVRKYFRRSELVSEMSYH